MPTYLSIRTIALRLRKAIDTFDLTAREADNLIACAVTLEEVAPPTLSQLEAIRIAVAEATDNSGLPLDRCVTSLDHWIERAQKYRNGEPIRGRKPGWMTYNEQAAAIAVEEARRPGLPGWMDKAVVLDEMPDARVASTHLTTSVEAIVGAMRILLDEIEAGIDVSDTADALAHLAKTYARLVG